MTDSGPIIFISSTCYDLTDLRAELKADLEKDGFIVKLSDDWASGFKVNPSVDSIESCLENLRSSDAALFIFDRRYGPPVPGDEENRSATHIEFDYATELVLENDFKRFTFVRKNTLLELSQWEADSTFAPDWVQRGRHKELFELIKKAKGLRRGEPGSNWIDQFETSLDLKQIARKRLWDEFPKYAGARALTRDRLVRLTFRPDYKGGPVKPIKPLIVNVLNAGMSMAMNVQVQMLRDGNPEGNRPFSPILQINEDMKCRWELQDEVDTYEIVCAYENPWGDKYCIRASVKQDKPNDFYYLEREVFMPVVQENVE